MSDGNANSKQTQANDCCRKRIKFVRKMRKQKIQISHFISGLQREKQITSHVFLLCCVDAAAEPNTRR
jgi:hypothetical protein